MTECPICSLEPEESTICSPLAPSMCWLKTTKLKNNLVEMEFGYGDDFEHIRYFPQYCPECGAKITRKDEKQ